MQNFALNTFRPHIAETNISDKGELLYVIIGFVTATLLFYHSTLRTFSYSIVVTTVETILMHARDAHTHAERHHTYIIKINKSAVHYSVAAVSVPVIA